MEHSQLKTKQIGIPKRLSAFGQRLDSIINKRPGHEIIGHHFYPLNVSFVFRDQVFVVSVSFPKLARSYIDKAQVKTVLDIQWVAFGKPLKKFLGLIIGTIIQKQIKIIIVDERVIDVMLRQFPVHLERLLLIAF
jgi:hypothetical protein